MQKLETNDTSPHPTPARARTHTNEHREQRRRTEHDAQFRRVPRGPPERAEVAIRILTVVLLATRERAACIIGIPDASLLARTRKVDNLLLAAL